MNDKLPFIIAESNEVDNLMFQVNDFIKQGYTPHGSMVVSNQTLYENDNQVNQDVMIYCQPMILLDQLHTWGNKLWL